MNWPLQRLTGLTGKDPTEIFPEICKAVKKGDRNIQMLKQLGIQLGSNRVMRCYGRISLADISNDTKFPKLLPKEGTFSKLVIEEFHKRLCHAGVTHTLSQIRHEYWIPQGRATVRKILKGCLMCKRVDGGPFQLPSMPYLPASRVIPSPPFTHTGLDYFGPMFVKTEKGQKKVWACIFTCLTVRAIHLELVEDMSADQFLLCLRRFMARRGKPLVIHCDNAPQFKVAKSAMDILWKQVISAERVQSHLSTSGTQWKFITEMAPWMGGYYERLVGVVKRLIKRSIGQKALTTTEITTLFAEIEASVNFRPIVFVGEDIESCKALTPSHFLSLNPKTGIVVLPGSSDDEYSPRLTLKDKLVKDWKAGELKLTEFWKVWKDDYLLNLRESLAMEHKQPGVLSQEHPKLNEMVLVKEMLMPRGLWRIASVEKLIEGSDGKVRTAKIRLLSGKVLNRPVNHLFPLEVKDQVDIGLSSSTGTGLKGSSESCPIPVVPPARRVVPKRIAAIRAQSRIHDQLRFQVEDEDPT